MTTTTQTINVPAGLHYTKSGRLDMRYNSSKEFLARTVPRRPDQHEGLHYTKAGHLDMRYNSSKEFLSRTVPRSPDQHEGLHYTKSERLDMRYNSSRAALGLGPRGLPAAATPTHATDARPSDEALLACLVVLAMVAALDAETREH